MLVSPQSIVLYIQMERANNSDRPLQWNSQSNQLAYDWMDLLWMGAHIAHCWIRILWTNGNHRQCSTLGDHSFLYDLKNFSEQGEWLTG